MGRLEANMSSYKNKLFSTIDLYIYLHWSKQLNVSGIKIFRAQFQSLKLRKEMLNAANIYLFEIILTKCKYIYRYFQNYK